MKTRFYMAALWLLISYYSHAQYHMGLWTGAGEYLPGAPFTNLMQQMGAEKKLVFDISSSGAVTGKLFTAYSGKGLIPHEGGDQQFTITGKFDLAGKKLLLVITHFRSRPDSAESYLTFAKPDSVVYDLFSRQNGNDLVITGIADTLYNTNTTAEWVGSFRGGGLSMAPTGNNTMHILPLRIRFNMRGEKELPGNRVANAVYGDTMAAKAEPKTRVISTVKYPVFRNTKIQRTIVLDSSAVKLELYDNGEIDGDIVTLFLDGKTIVNKQMLTAKPITVNLNISTLTAEHTLELFANNLGLIPPNTALVVLTCRNKRYEINLSSDETTNGAVKLVFKR